MKYKRIVVSHYGGPEVLQVIEDDLPEPKQGEVRVKILTAGVAWGDTLKREGWAGRSVQPPFTPGYDIVGLVDKRIYSPTRADRSIYSPIRERDKAKRV